MERTANYAERYGYYSGRTGWLFVVGGAALAVGSYWGLSGSLRIIIGTLGCTLMFGAAVIPALRAVPKPKYALSHRQPIAYDDVQHYPDATVVGLLGLKNSGKTTLLAGILHDSAQVHQTARLNGIALRFPVKDGSACRDIWAVVLDGDGANRDHWRAIAASARAIVILVDHNYSESDRSIDRGRLAEHRALLKAEHTTLAARMTQAGSRSPIVGRIHFLLTKNDLWGNRKDVETQLVQYAKWAKALFDDVAQDVSWSPHSNWDIRDVCKVRDVIVEFCRLES